jgi:hypothetical protein
MSKAADFPRYSLSDIFSLRIFLLMNIFLEGIVIISGNYGSGKTEVAINLAVYRKSQGVAVRVADLDIVNTYFRTREARSQLAELGIEVVLPPEQYMQADLPIISRSISGLIRHPSALTILDVGGNNVGAMVLASLADAFQDAPYQMLQVVNPFRPLTQTIEGAVKMKAEIEKASRMSVGGWIGNANLIDESTTESILSGYVFMKKLSEATGLPLVFITAPDFLLSELKPELFSCPILPIKRQLVPPWKQAVRLKE